MSVLTERRTGVRKLAENGHRTAHGTMLEREVQLDPLASAFLKHGGTPQTVEKRKSLFRQGADSDSIHLVTSGHFILERKHEDGRLIVEESVRSGRITGWDTLTGKPYTASAVAEEESGAISLSLAGFQELMSVEGDLRDKIFALFGTAYVRAAALYDRIRYGDARERVVGALGDLRDENNHVRINQDRIAQRAGAARSTVYVESDALKEKR